MTVLTRDELNVKADDLEEIREQMLELLNRAHESLRGTGMILSRAEAYWIGRMEGALDQANRYDVTMESTIKELRGDDDDEGEDDEEHDPEACPECGCVPGDGLTIGCTTCKSAPTA